MFLDKVLYKLNFKDERKTTNDGKAMRRDSFHKRLIVLDEKT